MNTDANIAAADFLVGKRIVEILSVIRIDGEHGLLAVIQAVSDVGRTDAIGQDRGLLFHVRRKLSGQIVLEKDAE